MKPRQSQHANQSKQSITELFDAALSLEDKADRFGGTSSIEPHKTAQLYKQAAENYHEILIIKPNSFDAAFNLARLYQNLAEMLDDKNLWYRKSLAAFDIAIDIAEKQVPDSLLQQRLQLTSWTDASFSKANTMSNLVEALPDEDPERLNLMDTAVKTMANVVERQRQLLALQQQDLQSMQNYQESEATSEPDTNESVEMDTRSDAEEDITQLDPITLQTISETLLSLAQLLTQSIQIVSQYSSSVEMVQNLANQAVQSCDQAMEGLQNNVMLTLEANLRKIQVYLALAQFMVQTNPEEGIKGLDNSIKDFDVLLNQFTLVPGLEKRVQAGLSTEERNESSLWTEALCDKAEACRDLAMLQTSRCKPLLAQVASSYAKALQVLYPQAPFTSKAQIYARAGDVELMRMRLVYWSDLSKPPAKEAQILTQNAINYFKRMVNEGKNHRKEQMQGLIRSVWAQTWLKCLTTDKSSCQSQIDLAMKHLGPVDPIQTLIESCEGDSDSLLAVEKIGWPV